MKKDDCIFCKLANGEIPTNALYEDDIVKVIFDANPAAKGHKKSYSLFKNKFSAS